MRHGIFVNEVVSGVRPILAATTAIIGLVVTAPDAVAASFPLDRPVLVTDIRAALADAGTQGTLKPALEAIADQVSPSLVIVRVAPGVGATAAADTEANVIGDVVAGDYTGIKALLAAEAQLGVRPRILGAPGLDTQAVINELVITAKKLRGFVYAQAEGDTIAEAITYREDFAARELMLLWPNFSGGFAGDAVARAMGLRARIDEETGWHQSLSNIAVDGVTGLSKDVYFDMQDASTDAGVLNAGNITTLVRMNGFRFWGNRTCSDEPLFVFETTVRTAQALKDEIGKGLAWAIDKPLSKFLIKDIVDTINARLRRLVSEGRIIGGQSWFDPALNDADQLAAGKLVIDFDYTPCAPVEDLGINQRLTDRYYFGFADQLTA